MENLQPSHIVHGDLKWCNHDQQISGSSKEVDIELPNDIAIPLHLFDSFPLAVIKHLTYTS